MSQPPPTLDYRTAAPAQGFVCERTAEGLLVTVSPSPVRVLTLVGIAVGTLASAVLALATVIGCVNVLAGGVPTRIGLAMPACLLVIVGGMTIASASALREQPTFLVAPSGALLATVQYLLRGRREYYWPAGHILRIVAHRCGSNWAGREVYELRIISASKPVVQLLVGRSARELRGLVLCLQRGLRAENGASNPLIDERELHPS